MWTRRNFGMGLGLAALLPAAFAQGTRVLKVANTAGVNDAHAAHER